MATRSKSFSRSLLKSERFWRLKSDSCRLFYILVQLDMDNIGRTQGNMFYLKGKLYDNEFPVSCEMAGDYLADCEKEDLYITYKVKGHIYIQDPFHLRHNKIVGNMLKTSDYPPPPVELIKEWEIRTNEVYTLYRLEDKDKGKEQDKDKDIKPKNTWLSPYASVWREVVGGEMAWGKAARFLSSLHKEHGQEKVAAHLKNYLISTEAKYVSLARFSETFGAWKRPHTKRTSAREETLKEIRALEEDM